MRKITIILFILFMIEGCGGTSGSTSSFDENSTNPTFTSDDNLKIDRRKIDNFTFTVSADDRSNLKYFITGNDEEFFKIDHISGVLKVIKMIPENRNNLNIFTVAEDTVGHRTVQKMTIEVFGRIDSSEQPPPQITERFKRDDIEEIVTDNKTNLMWQDDRGSKGFQKPWITWENYEICKENKNSPACNDTSGDTATTHCNNLTLGDYTNWRLPTKNELKSIKDASSPTFVESTFQSIYPNTEHWTSTTSEDYPDQAWGEYLTNETEEHYSLWIWKQDDYVVKCVRDIE